MPIHVVRQKELTSLSSLFEFLEFRRFQELTGLRIENYNCVVYGKDVRKLMVRFRKMHETVEILMKQDPRESLNIDFAQDVSFSPDDFECFFVYNEKQYRRLEDYFLVRYPELFSQYIKRSA
jgi:hypothetical protein